MPWTWTERSWKAASEAGKSWRSSRFKDIGRAIGAYNPHLTDTAQRLRGLAAILDAVSAWRVWKEGEKLGQADPGGYARDEGELRRSGQLQNDTSLSIRSKATDDLVKDVAAEIDDVLAAERALWGNKSLSDPALHKPGSKYAYLVTAQSESRPTPAYRQATVDNPDLIAGAVISASLITHESAHLWGPSGFILKAPKRCIAAAFHEDLGVANLVGTKHVLEKYRELLRIYLGDRSGAKVGVRAPLDVLPRSSVQHSEVMVLGSNYDKVTRVSGIFVVVDEVGDKDSPIEPAKCFVSKIRYVKSGLKPETLFVGSVEPSTTPGRMDTYRQLARTRDLPIVQIPMSAGVNIPASSLSSLYGNVLFPYDPGRMFERDSPRHRELEADGGKTWQKFEVT